jgi:hypothetical protein
MAREVREAVIGPYTYKVTLLGAKQGERMALQLAKLLAPTTAAFVDGLLSRPDGLSSIAVGVTTAVRQLVALVQPDELEQMQLALGKFTTVQLDAQHEPQLTPALFDEHFSGHYDWLMAWFAFALEANFTTFFAGTVDANPLLGRLMNLVSSLSPPPPSTAPTGASTESPPVATTAQA